MDARTIKSICFGVISFMVLASLAFGTPGVKQWRLVWNANSETDLAGYKVYHGTASRTYGPEIDVGNVTEWLIPTTLEGEYFFAVTAYDTSGNESDYSEEASHFFDQTAPAVPAGILLIER